MVLTSHSPTLIVCGNNVAVKLSVIAKERVQQGRGYIQNCGSIPSLSWALFMCVFKVCSLENTCPQHHSAGVIYIQWSHPLSLEDHNLIESSCFGWKTFKFQFSQDHQSKTASLNPSFHNKPKHTLLACIFGDEEEKSQERATLVEYTAVCSSTSSLANLKQRGANEMNTLLAFLWPPCLPAGQTKTSRMKKQPWSWKGPLWSADAAAPLLWQKQWSHNNNCGNNNHCCWQHCTQASSGINRFNAKIELLS